MDACSTGYKLESIKDLNFKLGFILEQGCKFLRTTFIPSFVLMVELLDWTMSVLKWASSPRSNPFVSYVNDICTCDKAQKT